MPVLASGLDCLLPGASARTEWKNDGRDDVKVDRVLSLCPCLLCGAVGLFGVVRLESPGLACGCRAVALEVRAC